MQHDWVGNMMPWELCKRLKLDQSDRWHMYNSESVLENKTQKILWDFEIQTDHQIPTRRPDSVD